MGGRRKDEWEGKAHLYRDREAERGRERDTQREIERERRADMRTAAAAMAESTLGRKKEDDRMAPRESDKA